MKRSAFCFLLLCGACGSRPGPDGASPPAPTAPAPRETASAAPTASVAPTAPTAPTAPAASLPAVPAASAAAAPAGPPAVSAAAARAAAEAVWKDLTKNYAQPALEGPGDAPECDTAGCAWKLDVTVMGRPTRATIGSLWVDATSKQVMWEPGDGRNKRWKIDEFLAHQKNEAAILKVVEALPEVKSYCARVTAQKLGCLVYVEQAQQPAGPCPRQPAPGDDCLLSVYVGEAHETHASRFTSVLVEPASRAIIGVSDTMCGAMSLAKWRARRRKSPQPDSCD